MFKFAHKRQVWWPVKIRAPKGDGSGEVEEHRIEVLYELLGGKEAAALQDIEGAEADAQVLGKIKGWKDVVSADGEPLEFTAENLAALADVPYIAKALGFGLLQASVGAPAKN